jgi:hypothetical protein
MAHVRTLVLRVAAVAMMTTVIGCAHVSPRMVVRDRFDYGQSLAESWKREMLLNVVRIRYADAPVFMDVTTVINSYSLTGSVNAGATLFSHTDPNEFPFGASSLFSNTPTVTYQPLSGDRFMKSLLRPIPPTAVFQMLQTGWSADMLLRISVRTINGLRNASRGTAPDPRFDQLIAAVSRLQQAGGLNIRIEEPKEGEAAIIALPTQPGGTMASDRAEVQRLLGLDPGATDYSLAYGLTPRSPTEIAVLTRSMIEIMAEYGFGIDVPDAERTEGRVIAGAPAAGGAPSTRLVHVLSGPSPPADAYAAVRYRDRWYWIADRDITSKLRFTLLMILSSLAETGVAPVTPVITVPSR